MAKFKHGFFLSIYVVFGIALFFIRGQATTKTQPDTGQSYLQDRALISLSDKLESFGEIHGNFTEILKDPNQGVLQKSHGRFWIKKPCFFKWQVISPNKQLLLSDGKKLWHYDEILEQVTVQKVPDMLSEAPYLLLLTGNRQKLKQLFTVEALKQERYRLTPKSDHQNLIQHIDLQFSGKTLQALSIKTQTGQSTAIDFSHIRFSNIPESVFHFTPPEGADILGA